MCNYFIRTALALGYTAYYQSAIVTRIYDNVIIASNSHYLVLILLLALISISSFSARRRSKVLSILNQALRIKEGY